MAWEILTAKEFQEYLIQVQLKKKIEMAEAFVMVSNSKELVEALAEVSTHGAIFVVISGYHFTSNDMVKVTEISTKKLNWKGKKKTMLEGN